MFSVDALFQFARLDKYAERFSEEQGDETGPSRGYDMPDLRAAQAAGDLRAAL